ncbi:hypothetical protein [Bradyrhizobium sp. Ash2021]|uniref:hypothetical protein n=1 Tax=Bradyrhizobium sp. Ash2021 TaxID=2954771 RepID=UPI00281668E7|nr:hypothetical protein [Bradyrhizobium sp. Ash2021]WMT72709.1 hypothetical protein NL528_32580 [Bradyrhizobium sp. Ash2021]
MLIRPAIGDTDPIRYRRPNPDGQFSGNIIDEAMRPFAARQINSFSSPIGVGTLGRLTLRANGDGILKIGRKLGIGTSVVQRVFKQQEGRS